MKSRAAKKKTKGRGSHTNKTELQLWDDGLSEEERAISAALETDNPEALNAAMGDENPLAFRFILPDGNSHGLLTMAALAGSWKCLLNLLDDRDRYWGYLSELDSETDRLSENDSVIFQRATRRSVDNGIHGAIEVYRCFLYWTLMEADQETRLSVKRHASQDEHLAYALAQIHAEEERASLSGPKVAPLPKSAGKSAAKGGRDGGL
jgi:hypothetical protein